MAATYETKIHHAEGQNGGDELVIESGGTLTVKSGGTIDTTGATDLQSGAAFTVKSGATLTVDSGGTVANSGAVDVETGGTITVKSGATLAVESGGILDMQAGPKQASPIVNITTSRAVTVAESGTTFFLKAVDLKMTLPSTAAGLCYTFVTHTVSSGTGSQIDPASVDAIHGGGLSSADDKDLINAGANDDEGDSVTIIGDGVDGWWIVAINGTWVKEG